MISQNVEDNLRFLIREVQKQVDRTQRYLSDPSREQRKSMLSRDNYIDNLRTFIQRACFRDAADAPEIEQIKSIDVVAVNLERIADFCEDVVGQLDYISQWDLLDPESFAPMFEEVARGLARVEEAVLERDVHVALSICRAEPRLDTLFVEAFQRGVESLRKGESPETHVTLLFIHRYFERMGDSLLNIGEAVISSSLGEKIKIGQLWALEDSLGEGSPYRSLDDVALHSMGESRSGCRISRVSDRDAQKTDATSVIFKEGPKDKLREEKAGIDRWESLVPGVAPKVFSFHENGTNAALLMEYIPGRTFEQVLLQGRAVELWDALSRVTSALENIWEGTRREEPVASRFSHQLSKRLDDVYQVHPKFRRARSGIGSIAVLPFEDLVERANELESHLVPPFSVLAHGDFNIDNIIYDPDDGRVRLIDLHRSTLNDWLQDASVFLVSNFRMQIFEAPLRARINEVMRRFYEFLREFAERHGDTTFGARLAFGLARSFATSTRFILDEEFAKSLFLRSRYLLDRLLVCPPSAINRFQLPQEILLD